MFRVSASTALFTAVSLVAAGDLPAQDHSAPSGTPHDAAVQSAPDSVPIYDDLGNHHYPITVQDRRAQRYFDQGLRLYYAFNHAEAVRSFRAAQAADPGCAMCWWGEALAWGPNINLPMDSAAGLQAYRAIQEARGRSADASEKERELIEALAVRYAPDAPSERAHLDRAWAEAMGELSRRYPDDAEVRVLHAEALMDLRPWDYWTAEGTPQPGIDAALAGLRHAQSLDEEHPGACHFYIHAVEKLYPERAVPCAERLAGLMPGAGHIVHMPGHIYIRVGRYLDAVEANRHAIHADETYIQDQRPGMGMYTAGYYPHNYDFLAFASMMIGQSETSLEAADQIASLLPDALFGTPGMDFLQHWSVRPLLMRIRFERWDEILSWPQPGDDRPHSRAILHYARGRAFAAAGAVAEAREELRSLRDILESGRLDDLRLEFNPSRKLVEIADRVLTGRLLAAEGRYPEALHALGEAVEREDALLYGEPPEWSVPTRQDLGAVLLEAGRWDVAERVFREDLDRFPRNGWSLGGLVSALRAQGRTAEADSVKAELEEVWATSDLSLPVEVARTSAPSEAFPGSGRPLRQKMISPPPEPNRGLTTLLKMDPKRYEIPKEVKYR